MLIGTQSLPVFGCTQNGDFKICHAHILGLLGRDSLIGTPRLATQYLFKNSVHFSSGVVISSSLFHFVAKELHLFAVLLVYDHSCFFIPRVHSNVVYLSHSCKGKDIGEGIFVVPRCTTSCQLLNFSTMLSWSFNILITKPPADNCTILFEMWCSTNGAVLLVGGGIS